MTLSKTADRAVRSRFVHPAIVLCAAVIAIIPLLINGPSCGHDYGFHLVSWFDALGSWRQGIAYPHWAASTNLGAGEPRFVFYPPLSWMLGAALGAILPWKLVPVALTFLILAACGLATRALGRSYLSETQATLAGCLGIFSGYAPYCAYGRTAFGELLGGVWIPLILLFALRSQRQEGNAWQRALDGSAVPLSLAIAGAWLSNGPVGVMACYLLTAVATLAAVLERSWAKAIRATVALVFGMALVGFYLAPVAHERLWVEMDKATSEPWTRIESNFVFSDNNYVFNPIPEMAEHDRVNHLVSLIGMTMLVLATGAIVVAWTRNRLAKRQQWIPLAAIPVAVFFLQLPISQPVWELPLLRMLQFPWRLLLILEAPIAIFLMLAIWPDVHVGEGGGRKQAAKKRRSYWQQAAIATLCGALFLAEIVVAFTSFPACTKGNSFDDVLAAVRVGGVGGQLEYAPDGTDNRLVALGLPGACLTRRPLAPLGIWMSTIDGAISAHFWQESQGSCEATYTIEKGPAHRAKEHYGVKAVLDHQGYLILRLRRYPAWHVSVNGRTVEAMPEREDGLMAVPVPAGTVNVDVDWVATPDVVVGRWLSTVGVLMLTGIWVLERKRASVEVAEARTYSFQL